jgi:hypothetical protein
MRKAREVISYLLLVVGFFITHITKPITFFFGAEKEERRGFAENISALNSLPLFSAPNKN